MVPIVCFVNSDECLTMISVYCDNIIIENYSLTTSSSAVFVFKINLYNVYILYYTLL